MAKNKVGFNIHEDITLPLFTPGQPILPFKIQELKFTRHGTLIRPKTDISTQLIRKPTTANQENKPSRLFRTLDPPVERNATHTDDEMKLDNADIDSSFKEYFEDLNFLQDDDISFDQRIEQLSFYPHFNYGPEKKFIIEFPMETQSDKGAFITDEEPSNQVQIVNEAPLVGTSKELEIKRGKSVVSLSSELSLANSQTRFQLVKKPSRGKTWLKYIRAKAFDVYDFCRKKMRDNSKIGLNGQLYTHENVNFQLYKKSEVTKYRSYAVKRKPTRLIRFTEPKPRVKVEKDSGKTNDVDPSIKEFTECEEVVGALLFIKAYEETKRETQQKQVKEEITEEITTSEPKNIEVDDESLTSSISDCKSFVNDYIGSYVFIDVD